MLYACLYVYPTQKFHGYIALVLSIIGLAINVTSIIIFKQPHMMQSPTNRMFMVLAVVHAMGHVILIPYHVYDYILNIPCKSKMGKQFILTCYILAYWVYNTAAWLIVAMAGIRYKTISISKLGRQTNVAKTVCIVVVWAIVITVPPGMLYEVKVTSENETCYDIELTDLAASRKSILSRALFAIAGVVTRCMPYVVMAIYTALLSKIIISSVHRRSTMNCSNNYTISRTHMKTTTMLVVIIMIEILVEFPNGVFLIINAFDDEFYDDVLKYLRQVLALFTLMKWNLNIFVYYVMSTTFRDTFKHYILRCCPKVK